MASGMDYGLRPGFFKFECRKFGFKFDVEPSNVWPLARTAVADSRNFQACGLCKCAFSKRVAIRSFWLGFEFAVCTFPYRMARVMECLAKIGCPILKFPVIIDFVMLWF